MERTASPEQIKPCREKGKAVDVMMKEADEEVGLKKRAQAFFVLYSNDCVGLCYASENNVLISIESHRDGRYEGYEGMDEALNCRRRLSEGSKL